LNIIKASTNYLKPGQIPVVAMGQLLYSLAKTLQWNFPDAYGESFIIFYNVRRFAHRAKLLEGVWEVFKLQWVD
jgi:hypothetical protein